MSNLDSPIAFNDLVDGINDLDSNKLNKKPDGTNSLIDSNNKVSLGYLPDVVLHQMVYGGTFVPNTAVATLTTNAKSKLGTTSNTITLTNNNASITGYGVNEGCFYICSASGTFAGITFSNGDWLVSTGTAWDRVDTSDAVVSVEGRTGSVTVIDDTKGAGDTTYTWSADKLSTLTSSIVSDVQVNSSSVVTGGVANIPLGSSSVFGVVRGNTSWGVSMNSGILQTVAATTSEIDLKANQYKPITPYTVDYVVKTGVTTNTLTLTSTEKTAANTWLGSLENIQLDGTDLTKDANNKVNIQKVSNGVLGLVKGDTGIRGVNFTSEATPYIVRAIDTEIDAKTSGFKPLTPVNIDYATKVGLTTNTLTLTTSEKATACAWLGAGQETVFVDWTN